jgi:acyl-CoA carboxylase epsilon subunit-like protein
VSGPETRLRVLRGRLSETELAVVVTVLLARLAAAGPDGDGGPRRAGWRRPEPGYRPPAGWR